MLKVIGVFFSGLSSKVISILVASVGFLLMVLKIKSLEKENEELEDKNIMHQEKDHITEEMNKVKKEEEQKADEDIEDINTDDWRKHI